MKLQVVYNKTCDGNIKATLTVIDKEDYPDDYIFCGATQYPTDDDYRLGTRRCTNYISKTLSDNRIAFKWVEDQVDVLSNELNRWRYAGLPKYDIYYI